MNKLLTFVLAAMAFVACTQNDVEELSANRADVPETLTVGFEGGDTRIELNEALKTVWTEGDEVSVFYQSYENTRWAFQGTTGDRSGELKRVSGEAGAQTMDNSIVVYPYSDSYAIDADTHAVAASLPAVQSYKEGSYGAEGNIMVAESKFTQSVLKSVVGWLRVELTGEGESVRAITLRGNAGEQVAGWCYIDCTTATATLVSEMGAASDEDEMGGVGGGLEFDDTVFTEVTLDCGDGVELGSEVTAFYIALLPQTFEHGITVEVECGNGTSTTKSTADKLVVERNHIVPMASFKYDGVLPEVYELAYTTNDGKPLDPYTTEGFGGEFVENIYDAATSRGVLKFAGAITTIPEQAFAICENLTWIDIPEGITIIGKEAFTGCTALAELTIPSTLTSLGSSAFKNCSFKATINCENVSFYGADFTEVIIGDNVTTIGKGAFEYCNSLTSVTIPDSVTTIGYEAFAYCDSLTSVTIGDNVTTIGDSAFESCSSLTSVTIPDSVTTIGGHAFAYCDILTSVTIPDSVTTIGNWAFGGCGSLTSVIIPDSVTTIGGGAFYNCDSLTSVTIGDSVTTIGNSAFNRCHSLTSVTIPDSVTTIGNYAFSYCSSLTSVTIPDSVTTIGNRAFYYCDSLTSVTIGDSVTTIGDYAFYWCSRLTSVTIPDSVTTIGEAAFYYCSSLTSVTIPDSVTTIGYRAFYDCKSLTSVVIPDSVTTIGDEAFYGCESLTSVTIGDSVTTIGYRAFYECRSLTSVYCEATTPPTLEGSSVFDSNKSGRKIYVPEGSFRAYKMAGNWSEYADYIVGYDFNSTVTISYTTSDGMPVDAHAPIVINSYQNGVGELKYFGKDIIPEYLFRNCDNLTSVTIPDSVMTIGIYAFLSCDRLTSVTIGNSVTTIGSWAFSECYSLTNVTIPDSVTSIGYRAFYECDSLTCITIPDSVTTIGEDAFYNCGSLTNVTIPDSVTTIGEAAFGGCSNLAEFKGKFAEDGGRCLIKNNTIIAYAEASGTTYTIPDSVTTIGNWAFGGCSSLTSVTIPDSVMTIGDYAFYDCDSLTSVYCEATTPPTLGYYVFDTNASGRKIYVPAASVDDYKLAKNWSDYAADILGYDFE